MNISQKGIDLIKKYEGCRLQAYLCPGNVYSIGYGHTGPDVFAGKTINQAEADRLLREDLKRYESYVEQYIKLRINQNQFDALVSFVYNCGPGNLKTLVADRGLGQIAEALLLYNKSAGKVLEGLKKRRAEERSLFLSESSADGPDQGGQATDRAMTINIHAGHNPDGKVACGAVGLMKESTEARIVVRELIKLLETRGCTVYDCTCNNGTSQSDVLNKIIKSCNAHEVDLDIAIHFNAVVRDFAGDGKTTGTECFVYDLNGKAVPYAHNILDEIEALGFRNRGVKVDSRLIYLKGTRAPAILLECCFVDDADDVRLYDEKKMAQAICNGILDVV